MTRKAYAVVLLIAIAALAWSAAYAGYQAHYIHHCNVLDLERCYVRWSFAGSWVFAAAVGGCAAFALTAFGTARLRRTQRRWSRLRIAASVFLLGLIALVTASIAHAEAIAGGYDPSRWLWLVTAALIVEALVLCGQVLLTARRSDARPGNRATESEVIPA